jgi:peptide chain release factor 3
MDAMLAETEEGDPVLLCQFEWSINQIAERNKGCVLRDTHLKAE